VKPKLEVANQEDRLIGTTTDLDIASKVLLVGTALLTPTRIPSGGFTVFAAEFTFAERLRATPCGHD